MCHFSLLVQYRQNLPAYCGILALTFVFVLLNPAQKTGLVQAAEKTNTITAISSEQVDNTFNITLEGTTSPTYTVYELFKPARIVVDVADTSLSQQAVISLPKESGITLSTSDVTDSTPPLTRFTFTLNESRPFSVAQNEKNIIISLKSTKPQSKAAAAQTTTDKDTATKIHDIKVLATANETKIQLIADGKISNYTHDVLDKSGSSPPRLYIDIENISGDTLLKEQKFGTALAGIRVAKRGSGLRFVLDSSKDTLFPFQVSPLDNGLEIRIEEDSKQDELSELIQQKQTIESQLPEIDPLRQKTETTSAQSVADAMTDAFNFSGYKKERITIDFYKIDIHNVFRLLREVSNTNIVVDEAVAGSLTLALNDVPWDFALDIILNLKNLQKEERFNTIVILPKSKAFNWPERAEDNLSFETDETVTEREAILIQQQMSIPKTVIAAKKYISKAQEFEKREEFESAIHQYELALQKWQDNAKLANKISSIYLVQLRQNAKALYFAKKALAIDQNLAKASLNAAIASANMKELKNSQQFFEHAVQGKSPLKEALLSYAVFSEEQKHYPEALKLLKKYDILYGENLNSMVARARIFDKQGKHEDATAEYNKIILSGYRIAPDLKKYILGRIALSQPQ